MTEYGWLDDAWSVPKSRITAAWLKSHGITEKVRLVKSLIAAGRISPSEWRDDPTGRLDQIEYYSAESIIRTLELMEKREIFNSGEKKERATEIRRLNGRDMHGNTEPCYHLSRPELFLQPTFILHRK